MNCEVERISKEDWVKFSEKAHLIAFSEAKPAELDRIDFALLAKNERGLMGYVTCRELDANSLYWQYGGTFPGTKDSSMSLTVCMRFLWWAKKNYKRVSFFADNTNLVMLKMGMKMGFYIVGIRNFKGHILLENHLEFEA